MPMFFPGAPYAGSGTWANRPATIPAAGTMYFASDLGENGTLLQSNGTRWRPVNGGAALKTLLAASANIANAETNVIQTLLPVNSLQIGDVLRLALSATKSGSTDSLALTVRIGTLGTTGDTALTGLSAYLALGAASLAGGGLIDIRLISATSVQKLGTNNSQNGTYTAFANSGAIAAATAITDASANALYVSVNVASTGATDTVKVTSANLQLITP